MKKKDKSVKHPEKRNKGTNIKAVVAMEEGGLKRSEIAEVTDTSPANITQVLQRYGMKKEEAESFSEYEDIIQDGIRHKIVKGIKDIDIKPENAQAWKNFLTAYGIAFDKNRLKTNKSTANLAMKIENIDPERLLKLKEAINKMYEAED